MRITKKRIVAMADELYAAGITPTLANVREQLAGGSPTTISEALGEWRACKASQGAADPRLAVSRLH